MQMHAHLYGKPGVSNQDSFVTFLSSGPSLNSIAASCCSVFPKYGRIGPVSNSLEESSCQEGRYPDWWIQAFIEFSLQKLFSLQAAAQKEIWHHLELPACVYKLSSPLLADVGFPSLELSKATLDGAWSNLG